LEATEEGNVWYIQKKRGMKAPRCGMGVVEKKMTTYHFGGGDPEKKGTIVQRIK